MNSKIISLISIAFRNLGRHKVKTILTMTAIAVGITMYIWLDAWLKGANIDSRRNLVNFETGAAKIYSKAYFEKKDEKPLYESFGNYKEIIKKLDQNGYNSAPRAVFTGTLKSKEEELPFIFIGIDPASEEKVFRYNKYLEKGSNFIENGKFEALIGVRGAKNLNLKIGDDANLYTVIDKKDENGKIKHIYQLINIKIAGIINSPNPMINGNFAYLPLDILQDRNGILLEGNITEICIRKKDAKFESLPGKSESPEIIKNTLGKMLPDNLTVVSWQEDAKDYLALSGQDKVSSYILISLLFILAIIGISNTMLMAVYERTKEIGMLRSLGMKDSNILQLFLIESGLIGFIGSIIGILLGILINIYMIKYGIDYSKMMESANMHNLGYRLVGIFRSTWNWGTIALSGVIATLVASITAFIPARKAIKMSIVDTLKFE